MSTILLAAAGKQPCSVSIEAGAYEHVRPLAEGGGQPVLDDWVFHPARGGKRSWDGGAGECSRSFREALRGGRGPAATSDRQRNRRDEKGASGARGQSSLARTPSPGRLRSG